MATLLLENVPDELLERFTRRARAGGKTVTEEVVELMTSRVVTDEVEPYSEPPTLSLPIEFPLPGHAVRRPARREGQMPFHFYGQLPDDEERDS